jgi:hypothetical protein
MTHFSLFRDAEGRPLALGCTVLIPDRLVLATVRKLLPAGARTNPLPIPAVLLESADGRRILPARSVFRR